MAVGIEEDVGATVTEIALEPLALDAGRLECGDPALQGLCAVCPVGNMPDPSPLGGGQLQRGSLVVAEATQVDGIATLAGDFQPEDLPEVVEALVRLRRQELDV